MPPSLYLGVARPLHGGRATPFRLPAHHLVTHGVVVGMTGGGKTGLLTVTVGVVAATQNPMDLDYRALGNAGLWCVGRLQTDADRARVVEGLAGSATAADDA